jgi:hypothetical protein
MNEILKKKKLTEVNQVPNFDHDDKDIVKAIGVPHLIESISEKMKTLVKTTSITSPSRVVEYFYNNFSLIELSFMAMHSLGHPKDQQEEEFPKEETI